MVAGQSRNGLGLVELLVAMALLALATTVALTLFDSARRSFKQGENRAEQQQAARVAFDMIESDLRMAGFNANPDGDRARPDEPIEGAFATAIVLRADFDAGDPVEAADPEQALGGAGAAFGTVSTGNDEIRTYVLARPGVAGGDTLRFSADVGEPVRDGRVEPVTIENVALSQDAPPYTLYRMTLDNDPGRCCSGRFIVRTPVAENVRSFRLRYYDRAGNELAPGGGLDSPGSIAMRGSVRLIGVELEVLTRDPDPLTRRYRRLLLAGDVAPRNLGKVSIESPREDP